MTLASSLRAFQRTQLGRTCIIFGGWTFVFVDEFIFDEYIYGNITVFCNDLMIRVLTPLTNDPAPHFLGRTAGALLALLFILPMAAIMCRLYMIVYDWTGVDWLGFEAVKDLGNGKPNSWLSRLRARLIALGGPPAFVLLSVWKDAFVTTAFMRRKDQRYAGMTPHDWKIFWGSLLISVAFWTLRWSFITFVVQMIFPHLPPDVREWLLGLWEINLAVLHWLAGLWSGLWSIFLPHVA